MLNAITKMEKQLNIVINIIQKIALLILPQAIFSLNVFAKKDSLGNIANLNMMK